jgi:NADPH-dependent 2,4-dienoyl-CoA reductase/sulfur reductase-like enzyme
MIDKVLIVGGGIAGLKLAIGLKRAGIQGEIVEISTDWTVSGLGLSLQGPAEIHRSGSLARHGESPGRGAGALFLLRAAQHGRGQSGVREADVHLPRAKPARVCAPPVIRKQLAEFRRFSCSGT